MYNKNTITKEELINLIQSSKTMEDAASKLEIDRRTLLRLREKFGIVHISANVNKKTEEYFSDPSLLDVEKEKDGWLTEEELEEAWRGVPEDVRKMFMDHAPTNIRKEAEDNLSLMKEVLVNNAPKEEVKPKLESFTKIAEKQSKQIELKALESNLLIDTNDYTHIVIPDCQISPGVPTEFLEWIGKYIAHIKPKRVICLGDFADMKSLYNYKKESFDSNEYKADIESAIDAMEVLMRPILDEMKKTDWKPSLDFVLGNHEHRITKVSNTDKKIGSFISVDDLRYKKFGWTVHDFLVPAILDNIAYAHYFTSTNMGAPIPSAKNLVDRKHMSCVMGHRQNWEMHRTDRPDGTSIVGLLAGSCYLHDEEYLGPQGNNYSRQIWVLNNIDRGSFTPVPIELKQLKRVYGN